MEVFEKNLKECFYDEKLSRGISSFGEETSKKKVEIIAF